MRTIRSAVRHVRHLRTVLGATAMRRIIIGVTGTPGSGKSRFAAALALRLRSFALIELNELVERHHCYSGADRWGTKIVEADALSRALGSELRGIGNCILVGHLLPELRLRPHMVVVTRVSLTRLAARLKARGYPLEKIRDNIICEATDYCGAKCAARQSNVYEVESGAEKRRLIAFIEASAKGGCPDAAFPPIDKFRELLSIATARNAYRI